MMDLTAIAIPARILKSSSLMEVALICIYSVERTRYMQEIISARIAQNIKLLTQIITHASSQIASPIKLYWKMALARIVSLTQDQKEMAKAALKLHVQKAS